MENYFDVHSATWDANRDRVERANAIARLGVAEPDGILRSLARTVAPQPGL